MGIQSLKGGSGRQDRHRSVRISDGCSIVPRIEDVALKDPFAPTSGGPDRLRDPRRRLRPIGCPGVRVFGQAQEFVYGKATAPAVHRHQVEPTDDDGITGSDVGLLPYD
jgi:hypothetical protein